MNDQPAKKNNPILEQAWKKFADYDWNAITQQKSFHRFQHWILIFGGIATLLVLAQTQWVDLPKEEVIPKFLQELLRFIIIIIPITITVLVAASTRFKPGIKWINLRTAAEEIKSQIYRYRTLASLSIKKNDNDASSDETFIEKLADVTNRLMKTEVSQTALGKYKGKIPPPMYMAAGKDDGYSPLSPDKYIEIRIDDQLAFYNNKTARLERKWKSYQWMIYIFGGLGTFLAAVGLELWVALTTSIVAIFTTYLEYRQVENNLMIYNQAASSLNDIKSWWVILPPEQKENKEIVQKLLDSTEKALQGEQNRWLQNMESALEGLRAKRGEKEGKNE